MDMNITSEKRSYGQYDSADFDRYGFNQDGLHKNGTLYDDSGFNQDGFNQDGLHRNGTQYDDDGFNKDGTRPTFPRKGTQDEDGIDQYGDQAVDLKNVKTVARVVQKNSNPFHARRIEKRSQSQMLSEDKLFRISVKVNNLEAWKQLGITQYGSEVEISPNLWIVTGQVTEDQYRVVVAQPFTISVQCGQKIGPANHKK